MTILLRRTIVAAGIALLLAGAAFAIARPAATTDAPPLEGAAAAVEPPAAATAATAAAGADVATDPEFALELDAILAADATATKADRGVARGKLRRLAAWNRLVHATVVVDRKEGGLTTVQLDHGTISAVTATSLTITETGGGAVTVRLGDETRVRRDGAKAAIGALKAGDGVFAMSKVEAGGTTAYLVVVPRR
jgi:hypothetical protein